MENPSVLASIVESHSIGAGPYARASRAVRAGRHQCMTIPCYSNAKSVAFRPFNFFHVSIAPRVTWTGDRLIDGSDLSF